VKLVGSSVESPSEGEHVLVLEQYSITPRLANRSEERLEVTEFWWGSLEVNVNELVGDLNWSVLCGAIVLDVRGSGGLY
jgi:hypothetical protein